MRMLAGVVLLFASACDPNAACRSLKLGDGVPSSAQPGGSGLGDTSNVGNNIELGPAHELWCCATPALKNCEDVDMASCDAAVRIFSLGRPYTYDDGYFAAQLCEVAAKDGKILAVRSQHRD